MEPMAAPPAAQPRRGDVRPASEAAGQVAAPLPARPSGTRFGRSLPTISPEGFERLALIGVWVLAVTIISGAAVRLTGSGLGCSTWPSCTQTSVVAPLRFHAWVEFGNRLVNAAVTIAALGTVFVALRRRPSRRDLTLLSAGLVVGLLVEVVMGALVVYSKLNPVLVSVHFLLGLAFLAVGVVLHHRAGLPDRRPAPRPMVLPVQIWLARLVLVGLTVVVSLGTVVTSTGPHGGSPDAPRFHFSLHSVAQLHGSAVEIFLFITLVMLWSLSHFGAPRPVVRRAQVMLVTLAAQAAVGYGQYLSGDPVAVVALHVAGASIAVIATLRFYMGLWDYSAVPQPAA